MKLKLEDEKDVIILIFKKERGTSARRAATLSNAIIISKIYISNRELIYTDIYLFTYL